MSAALYVIRSKEITKDNFLYGNRNVHWLLVAISMFSTYWINSTLFYQNLINIVAFTLLMLLTLKGWERYGVTLYQFYGCETIGDYFEKRCDSKECRMAIVSANLFISVLLRLALILIISGRVLQQIFGNDAFYLMLFVILLTGVYVIGGGIKSEMILQILLVISAFSLLLAQLLGYNPFQYLYPQSTDVGVPVTEWRLMVVSIPFFVIWSICLDPMVVHKTNCVNSYSLFSRSLKTVFILIVLFFGVSMFLFYQKISTIFTPTTTSDNSEWIIKTLVALSFFLLIMATVANVFNTMVLAVVYDFMRKVNDSSTRKNFVTIGRIIIVVVMLYVMLLLHYLQAVDSSVVKKIIALLFHVSALVSGVYVTNLLSQKQEARKVIISLYVGSIVIILWHLITVFLGIDDFSRIAFINEYGFTAIVFIVSVLSGITITKRQQELKKV